MGFDYGGWCAGTVPTPTKEPMMTEPQHGTYAGWNWHMRNGVQTCTFCRKAQADYQAKRRKAKPSLYAKEKAENAARTRALWKLADLHPWQFKALVQQELDRRESA